MQIKEETEANCTGKTGKQNYTVERLELRKTNSFSSLLNDYLEDASELKPFYGNRPAIHEFSKQIEQKTISPEKRQVLVERLQKQYEGLDIDNQTGQNIADLQQSHTYTVTTGHQLNLFTGPLYFIYKIISVINTCRQLSQKYPDCKFVPVYWMATEDHDFEEISHFRLFGKEYKWQRDSRAAVGRMDLHGLKEQVFDQLDEELTTFKKSYLESDNLANATRKLVHGLFGHLGLVIIDGDDKYLKQSFTPIIKDELLQRQSGSLVEESSAKLNDLGYTAQVFPREINLFYLTDKLRGRITFEQEKYQVVGSEITFTEKEILEELEAFPERFSPNVLLRPLYQETILPNLAYIGGPAEIAYWFQLKTVFDHYELPFPILMPRNFALVIGTVLARKLEHLISDIEELFLDIKELKAGYIARVSNHQPEIAQEMAAIAEWFEKIKAKAVAIDKSLDGFIGAEANKTAKSLENIEKRLIKSEERNQETGIKQLEGLKEKLFPGGGLQERTDNFLNFYINNPCFVDDLVEILDPFDFSMYVIKYA
ncbi:MAG: bacillithiol biosynthesis cysteine-adding enzyme BshC [Cyclobacteriaceae bacterium]